MKSLKSCKLRFSPSGLLGRRKLRCELDQENGSGRGGGGGGAEKGICGGGGGGILAACLMEARCCFKAVTISRRASAMLRRRSW